jgi:mannose-6-phosphate isomerase-like protein (cupin superfamily)
MTDLDNPERGRILDLYGARYFEPGVRDIYRARSTNLYDYTAYVGPHDVSVDLGDCLFYLGADAGSAHRRRGSRLGGQALRQRSEHFGVLIRGYMPDTASRELGESHTNLPYVNGCSTKQIFAPERLGDPTLQLLDIPPFSAEQAHHIHSTVRVVYVLEGLGVSYVGMEGASVVTELKPGTVVLLEPMCPHHFETPQGKHLVVLPVHVFSSVGSLESVHPMSNGTHLMNQGA